MRVPFSPPDISELEINEVAEALRSGWITTGPRTKQLEKEITEHILGIGAGDEVIVPAYTYTASASVVCHVGATLKLIDSQVDSLEMDYDALEKAITDKTKVIIPVDLGGVPCDYDRIFEIVEKKKSLFKLSNEIQKAIGRIAVCADTAHAFGAKRHGKWSVQSLIFQVLVFTP